MIQRFPFISVMSIGILLFGILYFVWFPKTSGQPLVHLVIALTAVALGAAGISSMWLRNRKHRQSV
jgi:hypothetical protein